MKITLETCDGGKRIISSDNKFTRMAKAFGRGFVKGATDKGTMTFSAGIGLWNGFKYKGNAKYGIGTALITDFTFACMSGISEMMDEKDRR